MSNPQETKILELLEELEKAKINRMRLSQEVVAQHLQVACQPSEATVAEFLEKSVAVPASVAQHIIDELVPFIGELIMEKVLWIHNLRKQKQDGLHFGSGIREVK